MDKKILAADFGASSGRVMGGSYNGNLISIEEIHRFSNEPVILNRTMYWDFLRLFYEMKQGLIKSKKNGSFESIGVDTWGVDFGLINKNGRLLENPVHYRDGRTLGMMKKSFNKIPEMEFYKETGNQFMEINTAFQLMAIMEQTPEIMEQADAMLLMPDLFSYYLSGEKHSEHSIASTTQLFHMQNQKWASNVIDKLGIPQKIFQSFSKPGSKAGICRNSLREELGISDISIITVAGHDTQSALAAVPTRAENFIFLSCGTWSLLGTELSKPIINEKALKYNLTNELGVEGKYSFLKNIIGLWLIQESRRQWIKEGREFSFGQLESMAKGSSELKAFINPDAPVFIPAGNIPERIRNYCKETGQQIPETDGEIVCCINQSLALTYRRAMEEIMECTGETYEAIHMVGGGINSDLLCQMTANACGISVIAGPVEATVFGNMMVQFMASGEFRNLKEAREVLIHSVETKEYKPENTQNWDEAYEKFCNILV